jgi:hypothetical protein
MQHVEIFPKNLDPVPFRDPDRDTMTRKIDALFTFPPLIFRALTKQRLGAAHNFGLEALQGPSETELVSENQRHLRG